jgi:hypothetical protein
LYWANNRRKLKLRKAADLVCSQGIIKEGMDYQVYKPHEDLDALVKCYWTLEVPAGAGAQRQRIIPDGCIEIVFILGDDIKRYTSGDDFIIQPRAFVLGQITEPFFIEPTGYVKSFAARFYPYGFAGFVPTPIKDLADKETPLAALFDAKLADDVSREIIDAPSTEARIKIIERFLLGRLKNEKSINDIVQTTVEMMLSAEGNTSIKAALKNDVSKRRQLERKFVSQIGISPKQLSKVVRLQAAIKMMLEPQPGDLSKIAYDSDYYDQAHFTKDFKEFTGTTPKEFFKDEGMQLSSLIYKQ